MSGARYYSRGRVVRFLGEGARPARVARVASSVRRTADGRYETTKPLIERLLERSGAVARPTKAKTPGGKAPGLSVHNPIKGGSNDDISQV